jgi:hypothetical protein
MAAARRKSIIFFCIALILLATFIPGVWLHPTLLVQVGFAFAAVASAPIARSSEGRGPNCFHISPIRSPRPPPVA